MRFALLQNAIRLGFKDSANRGKPLLRSSVSSICQSDLVQGRNEVVRSLHLLSLILQQRIIGLVVKALHQPDKHIRDIIKSACRLREDKGGRERQAFVRSQVVHGRHVKGPGFRRELFYFDVRYAMEHVV